MDDLTEYNRMLAGELYDASDPKLFSMRVNARKLLKDYNLSLYDKDLRNGILNQLLGKSGKNIDIQAPFFCDYGCFIETGDNFFANFNCVFLDCNYIRIGDNVFMGPNVQIYAAFHPVLASERIKGPERSAPVLIGDNVWIGGGSIICAGVKIGSNSTVGAGSVVIREVPPDTIVAGNPAKIIRKL